MNFQVFIWIHFKPSLFTSHALPSFPGTQIKAWRILIYFAACGDLNGCCLLKNTKDKPNKNYFYMRKML